MAENTEDRPFKCNQCSKTFLKNYLLNTHLKSVHSEKTFCCDICSRAFKVKGTLTQHLKTHSTQKKPFKCKLCPARFLRFYHLERHATVHTQELQFECPLCSKKFGLDFNMKRHMLTHTDERPHKCMYCDKSFRLSTHMKTHILLVHTKEKNFSCYICKMKFGLKTFLKKHLNTHPEYTHQSSIASTSKAQTKGNKKTVRSSAKTSAQPVAINSTQKKRSRGKSKQNVHLQIREDPVEWDLLEISVPSTSKQLDNPRSKEPSFQCTLCFKMFSRRTLLNRHMVTHSNEKPFECEICLKKFSLQDNLIRHKKGHNDERPHECKVCYKRFKQSHHLKAHMKMHGITTWSQEDELGVAVRHVLKTGITFAN